MSLLLWKWNKSWIYMHICIYFLHAYCIHNTRLEILLLKLISFHPVTQYYIYIFLLVTVNLLRYWFKLKIVYRDFGSSLFEFTAMDYCGCMHGHIKRCHWTFVPRSAKMFFIFSSFVFYPIFIKLPQECWKV